MISTTSAQSTTKTIQTKFVTKHKFGQNKTLPNRENAEETTKQHQIEKHLRESKHSHNLTERNFNYILPWVMFFLLFSLNVCYGIFRFQKRTEDNCCRMNFLPDVSVGRSHSENSGIGRLRQMSSLTALYDRDVVV